MNFDFFKGLLASFQYGEAHLKASSFSGGRPPPASYEFARAGYIFNAGDTDFHKDGELPFRLLAKDAADRAVVVAMISEYTRRKPQSRFENEMFEAIERASRDKRWRPWDNFWWAVALRTYGQNHRKKDYYNKAIEKANKAIRLTPGGTDAKWIEDWIAATTKERDHPTFGRAKSFMYVDDIDP